MPHGKRTSTNLWKKRPKSKLIGAAAHNEVALSPAQQLGSLGGAARARGRGVGGGGCAATLARALRWCRLPHVSECAFDVSLNRSVSTDIMPRSDRR